jgi:hypothetical protein
MADKTAAELGASAKRMEKMASIFFQLGSLILLAGMLYFGYKGAMAAEAGDYSKGTYYLLVAYLLYVARKHDYGRSA